MKYILLDTNVIVGNFWMDGGAFSALLSNYKVASEKLIIPQVVIDEVECQHEKKIDEELENIAKRLNNLEVYLNKFDLNGLIKKRRNELNYPEHINNLINKHEVQVLDYPSTEHSSIAKKAMRRSKPFKRNGEGYCDALIWENILSILKSDDCEELHFISNNSKDFYDGEVFHKELLSELQSLEIDENKLKAHSDLKKFTHKYIVPKLEIIDKLESRINENSIPEFNVNWWLEEQLFDYIDPLDAAKAIVGLSTEDCELHLSEVYKVSNVTAQEVRVIDSNTTYVELNADVGLSIEICADWQQYKSSSEIERIFHEADEAMPAPYSCVSFSGELPFKLSLAVKDNDFNNANIEVISIGTEA